jgi:peptide/nickel transport system substrate-binding protein
MLLVALLLAGCLRGPRPALRLVIGQPTSALTLDPHERDSYHTTLTLGHFYDSLVRLGPMLEPCPSLAWSWESPADDVWRFHLREDVTFHDGRPLGASDVVFSFDRARGEGSGIAHYLQSIEKVRAAGAHTVEITTRGPSAVLLYDLVFVAIVPEGSPAHIVTPVGTGPYRYESGRPGGTIAGSAFPRPWSETPAYRRFAIVPIPDAGRRRDAVARGTADVVVQLPEEPRARAETRVVSREEPFILFLGFSRDASSPFRDARLREAVARSVDRPGLVARGLGGRGAPLRQIVPPGVFGHAEAVPELPYDRAGARRLLEDAGFGAGLPTDLLAAEQFARPAEELARELSRVGVRVTPTVVPMPEFFRRWTTQTWPLVLVGWAYANGDASSGLPALLHSPRGGAGLLNRWGYASPRLDDLIERSERAAEPGARASLLAAAGAVVNEDLPVLPLATREALYAVRAGVVWSPRHDRVHAADFRPAM